MGRELVRYQKLVTIGIAAERIVLQYLLIIA